MQDPEYHKVDDVADGVHISAIPLSDFFLKNQSFEQVYGARYYLPAVV